MLFGDATKRRHVADARVGEDDIEASLLFADLREDPVQIRQFGYVSLDGGDVGTDGCDRSIQLRLPAASDVDIGAFLHELLCSRKADAGAATRDESDLTLEFLGHCFLRS